MEQYEQPGGNVRSKVATEEYKNNYDAIFRKPKEESPCSKHDGEPLCDSCGELVESPR